MNVGIVEPTKKEKEFFEKNFKWDKYELYLCKICMNWQTPLPYDMFRHYLAHSRLENTKQIKERIKGFLK